MAELTNLESKVGEVLGLAMASQKATEKVESMLEGHDDLAEQLRTMRDEAQETERRCTEWADEQEGKKTAILEKARETKSEATEMAKTYLGDEEEALDGFEFLAMAEAGELAHWEIVQKMASTVGEPEVSTLADWAVFVERGHIAIVREASLALAAEEAKS